MPSTALYYQQRKKKNKTINTLSKTRTGFTRSKELTHAPRVHENNNIHNISSRENVMRGSIDVSCLRGNNTHTSAPCFTGVTELKACTLTLVLCYALPLSLSLAFFVVLLSSHLSRFASLTLMHSPHRTGFVVYMSSEHAQTPFYRPLCAPSKLTES